MDMATPIWTSERGWLLKGVRCHVEASFVAAAPPLKCKRVLMSQWDALRKQDGHRFRQNIIDAKQACFYGRPARNLYVRPPAETGPPKHAVCGLGRCV